MSNVRLIMHKNIINFSKSLLINLDRSLFYCVCMQKYIKQDRAI